MPASDTGAKKSRTRRFFAHPLTRIFLELALFLGILVALKLLVIKPGLTLIGFEEGAFRAWQGILTIIAMYGVYVLLMKIYERRQVHELSWKHFPLDSLFGLLTGAAMVSAIFAALYLLGAYQIIASGSMQSMVIPGIWVILLAAMEELMFRGILYRILEQWQGTITALLVSAAIFGVGHIFNDHADAISVVSATAGGLLMGTLYSLTGRLWIPIFFHASWNFTQAIYGSTVSGTELFGTYFESVREGPEWLTGGSFGVENSLLTIFLLAVFIAICWLRMKSQNKFIRKKG